MSVGVYAVSKTRSQVVLGVVVQEDGRSGKPGHSAQLLATSARGRSLLFTGFPSNFTSASWFGDFDVLSSVKG